MAKEIVDLVVGEDGTYGAKNDKKLIEKGANKEKKNATKKKYDRRKADDFLSGLDAGITFVEELSPMVNRILKLRG